VTTELISTRTLAHEVADLAGVDVRRCYQCGKCSAGCPMASEMALGPHDILRLTRSNRREQLLTSDSIWLCLGCETCTARCPNACDPAAVIDALRELSAREYPSAAPVRIRAFHRAFLSQIKANGRLFELGLVVQYKLRGGSLLQDATAAPSMLTRGKLHARAKPIKGIDEVRQIFAACGVGSEGER
jgi:heterodisulfide reductase subunit C